MSRMHKIGVELLRHGPAHNQLLSPLTDYVGVCGDHSVSTVRVPYEHRDFLEQLKALRYRNGDGASAVAQRRDVAERLGRQMRDLLEGIHGLVPELDGVVSDPPALVHLEVVISAAELAMLPFELAKVPRGGRGGDGNWLLLQSRAPVCLTRRVRSVNGSGGDWTRPPRLLFAYADTPDMGRLPIDHLKLLIATLDPWLRHIPPGDEAAVKRVIGDHLTVVPQASLAAIAEVCSAQEFTHVHLLAHGARDPNRSGQPFGVQLFSADGRGFETVSGQRLAEVLHATPTGCYRSASKRPPLAVTVASCDGGNVGEVVFHGASFAHELHRAGIPMVVASQFPLSFAASRLMVETLYGDMLCGRDPRESLQRLRGMLDARTGDTRHDWASVVAYASLPADIDRQLETLRYQQAHGAIDAALQRLDKTIDTYSPLPTDADLSRPVPQVDALRAEVDALRAEGDVTGCIRFVDRAIAALPQRAGFTAESLAYRGTVKKRIAEAWFKIAPVTDDQRQKTVWLDRSRDALREALQLYRQAAREGFGQSEEGRRGSKPIHWYLTQYLSLGLILREPFEPRPWEAAMHAVDVDLEAASADARIWAHGSAVELWLLRYAAGPANGRNSARQEAVRHAAAIHRHTGPRAFARYSSRRQLQRYVDWLCEDAFQNEPIAEDSLLGRLKQLAGELAVTLQVRGPLRPGG